jgi:hypothetical protein
MDGNESPYLGVLAGWIGAVRDDSHSDGLRVDRIQEEQIQSSSPLEEVDRNIQLPADMVLFVEESFSFIETAKNGADMRRMLSFGYLPLNWLWKLGEREMKSGNFTFKVN